MANARTVSVLVGFLLLMGSIAALIIIVYQSRGSARSSLNSSAEESWRKRHNKPMKKADRSSTADSDIVSIQTKMLAKELEILFMNESNNIAEGNVSRQEPETIRAEESGESLSTEDGTLLPAAVPSASSDTMSLSRGSVSSDNREKLRRGSGSAAVAIHKSSSTAAGEEDFLADHDRHNQTPSINQSWKSSVERGSPTLSRHPPDKLLPSYPLYHQPSASMSSPIYSAASGSSINTPLHPSNRRKAIVPLADDNPLYFQHFVPHDNALLSDHYAEDQNQGDPLHSMGDVLRIVTDVYRKGFKTLDLSGLVHAINKTIHTGGRKGILRRMNLLYRRPEAWSPIFLGDSSVTGRSAVQNSLTTFFFMSFGIFLLNQIHKFIGTDQHQGRQGRNLLSENSMGDSELDFLFQPLPIHGSNTEFANTTTSIPSSSLTADDSEAMEARKEAHSNSSSLSSLDNMFRAGLNLINAYTKQPDALECIWLKYCKDLDKTAASEQNVYSVAARINSIGLRLIMGQIPKELTMDVMLESLLSWEGLPCSKMFATCPKSEEPLSQQL